MNNYFKTVSINLNFDDENLVTQSYNNGFVFTRLGKGAMNQTKSLRVDLSKFELSSENRRILNKTESLNSEFKTLPLENYSWEIHKLGKDFYSQKFGDGTMSASKIKEMFNDMSVSNMNGVFDFRLSNVDLRLDQSQIANRKSSIGYCLCYVNTEIIHYAYPFYNLEIDFPNLGLGMMLRAIMWAKENNKKYIYLGSVVDSSSKYKLQFEGLEWYDTDQMKWRDDIDNLKMQLS